MNFTQRALPWIAALLVLAGCASGGGYAPAREAQVQNAYGVPIPNARVVHVRAPSATAVNGFVATTDANGKVLLTALKLPAKDAAPTAYYIITAPGFEEFIVWPSMLAGDPAAGKGYRIADNALVITLTPLPGYIAAPPGTTP